MTGTGEFTGRHMALCMVGFFAVIIGVNITLAVFAGQTWSGLIVKNGYVASQEYNGVLAEARAQAARGWQGALSPEGDGVRLDIRDGNGAAVSGLAVSGRLGRPTHEHDDADIAFTESPSGGYSVATALAAGQWALDVTAVDGAGQSWRQIFRFTVPAGKG